MHRSAADFLPFNLRGSTGTHSIGCTMLLLIVTRSPGRNSAGTESLARLL